MLKVKHLSHPAMKLGCFCRFFVIRDGFLLYYPESERREFDKNQCLNLHPKVCSFEHAFTKPSFVLFIVHGHCLLHILTVSDVELSDPCIFGQVNHLAM